MELNLEAKTKFNKKIFNTVAIVTIAAFTIFFLQLLPDSYQQISGLFKSAISSEQPLQVNQVIPESYPESFVVAKVTGNLSPGISSQGIVSNSQGIYDKSKVEIASCDDCRYFPVDKTHALGSNYKPAVVDTNLAGGGKLTLEAKQKLSELFALGRSQGLKPKINSAYRSYADQLSTFNYWVQKELAKGISQQQAEINANNYSARPGHSEHQLGMTADIGCEGCSAFDRGNKGNKAIWKFLELNAHKYGFVISYTPDTQVYTGYVYEPWHIRYVGVELAKEVHAQGYLTNPQIYLAKILLAKRLWLDM